MAKTATQDALEEIGNILDLADELIGQKKKLQSQLSKGFLHLAQCKYIMGPDQISKRQFKTNMEATSYFAPCSEAESKELVVEKCSDPSVNPLNWFGVLVPGALRDAQKEFIQSLQEIVEIQNTQFQIFELQNRSLEE